MALDSIEICLVKDLFDVAHLSRVDGMVISIPYAEQDDPPNMIAVLGIDSKKIPCNIFVFLNFAMELSPSTSVGGHKGGILKKFVKPYTISMRNFL